ncbi:hypothetical protein GMB86_09070 [Terrilactibacillus sp. BCM23-1]|uniref:O-antigen ligase-related domain-containing protein n=1 Tax=Terrilactibacillus tamarindi TaxID=2599694 RepID=A0A6N8CR83_9BACI|nr:O-antigen ligase family protein [Terrilactibacillus tamarindi]MTT32158.1 hypothetical protein [Terrilactibacillus tamarindi]
MSVYFKTIKIILTIILSIIIGISSSLVWLVNNSTLSLELIVLVVFIIGYIICCLIFNPLIVFVIVSILSIVIRSEIEINPVEYLSGVGASDFYLNITHLVLFLGIISILIFKLKSNDKLVDYRYFNSRVLFVFLFVFFSLFLSFYAEYKKASFPQISFYLSLFGMYMFWNFIFLKIDREKLKSVVVCSFGFVILFECILILLELIKGRAIGLSIIGEGVIDQRKGVPFVSVTGTFGHPGPLSMFLLCVVVFLFPLVLQKKEYFVSLSFLLGLIGVILTFSRTSIFIVGFILIFEWILLNRMKNKKNFSKVKKVTIVLLLTLIVVVMGPYILQRFGNLDSGNDDQISNRHYHNEFALQYIREKPLLGYGLNSWVYAVNKYSYLAMNYRDSFFFENSVHNIYYLIWFEGGIFYLSIFILMFIMHITPLFNFKKYKSDPFILGLSFSLIAILLYGFLGKALHSYHQLFYLVFLIFTLINYFASVRN